MQRSTAAQHISLPEEMAELPGKDLHPLPITEGSSSGLPVAHLVPSPYIHPAPQTQLSFPASHFSHGNCSINSCPQIHPHLSVTFCKSIPSCFSFFCLLFCKQAVGCLTQQLKRCLFSVCWKTLWKSACTRATALSGDGSMKVPFSCTQESASLHHNLK